MTTYSRQAIIEFYGNLDPERKPIPVGSCVCPIAYAMGWTQANKAGPNGAALVLDEEAAFAIDAVTLEWEDLTAGKIVDILRNL